MDIIFSVKRGNLHAILVISSFYSIHTFVLFYGAGGLDAFADSTLPSVGRVTAHSLSSLPGLFTLKEVIT